MEQTRIDELIPAYRELQEYVKRQAIVYAAYKWKYLDSVYVDIGKDGMVEIVGTIKAEGWYNRHETTIVSFDELKDVNNMIEKERKKKEEEKLRAIEKKKQEELVLAEKRALKLKKKQESDKVKELALLEKLKAKYNG